MGKSCSILLQIVHLPNSNQITYHFHNKSSRVSVDAPWSELSGSNTNTDTSSLSPFCLQFDYRGPGTGKNYRGDAIGTRVRNHSGRSNRENGTTF